MSHLDGLPWSLAGRQALCLLHHGATHTFWSLLLQVCCSPLLCLELCCKLQELKILALTPLSFVTLNTFPLSPFWASFYSSLKWNRWTGLHWLYQAFTFLNMFVSKHWNSMNSNKSYWPSSNLSLCCNYFLWRTGDHLRSEIGRVSSFQRTVSSLCTLILNRRRIFSK